jgi:cell division protein FtsN
MRVAMIGVAIALASSTPALSSPSCMTQSEARAKFPKEHLWWRGANHCWDATPPSRQRLAQRIKRQPKQEARAEREPAEETKADEKQADEKRKAGWSNETRWREAMSRMRAEDMLELRAPARATASVDPVPVDASSPSPPRMNWGERWVDITQRFPPLPGKTGPADLAADAREVEPLVTPIRVMLTLLVLLLTLGAFELARRPSRRAD